MAREDTVFPEDGLQLLRKRIDELDRRLLVLLNERAQLSLDAARTKARQGLPRLDRAREDQLVQDLIASNPGPLADQDVEQVFRFLLERFRSLSLAEEDQEVR